MQAQLEDYIGEAFVKCAHIILGSRIFQLEQDRPPVDRRSGRWVSRPGHHTEQPSNLVPHAVLQPVACAVQQCWKPVLSYDVQQPWPIPLCRLHRPLFSHHATAFSSDVRLRLLLFACWYAVLA